MRLINDKKGLWLLKRVLNLVITVIVIFLLIIFIVVLWNLFTAESDLEKMEKQLDKIISGVKKVDSSGEKQFLIFFPPSSNIFHLRSIKNFNNGGCGGKGNCLCVCNDFPCRRGRKISTTMICKNLEIKTNIKTISILGLKVRDGFTQKQIDHEKTKHHELMNYSFDLKDYIRFEELTRIIIKDDGGTIKIIPEEDDVKDKKYFIKHYTKDNNPYRPKGYKRTEGMSIPPGL